MDKIAELIFGLLQPLKLPARLVAIAFTIILIFVSIYGYERITGQFYFSKLERKISLLKELQDLKISGIVQNPELYAIYQDTVKELSSFEVNITTRLHITTRFRSVLRDFRIYTHERGIQPRGDRHEPKIATNKAARLAQAASQWTQALAQAQHTGCDHECR